MSISEVVEFNITGDMTVESIRTHSAPLTVDRQEMRGTSPQSRLLAQSLRMTVRPVLATWARASALPWPFGLLDAVSARLHPPIEGTRSHTVLLDNCRAQWVRAEGISDDRVVLYLHGGGFLACGIGTHQRLASRISAAAEAPVLMADYRMLPDHSIDDAVADGVDAYRWLLGRGYRADQIVIAGDSAGGYLSFMVPLALREQGLPGPAGIVALSPLTDMDPTRKVAHRNAGRDPMLPRQALDELARISNRTDARSGSTRTQPRVCPIDADLHGLPPVLIQVGSHELLLPDSELIADRLAEAGVPCELQVWRHQVHVFQVASDLVPEAQRAIDEIGYFIKTRTPALTVVRGSA
ncbi:alpha/beta hydrolase [Rhodococcus kronopolitis]|uniref:Alpha/beta hydrolase n=1 Tax=Rhodococcus kronopolitis TaxID=1460226 RepID=A0ABV9FWL4_9NOCA